MKRLLTVLTGYALLATNFALADPTPDSTPEPNETATAANSDEPEQEPLWELNLAAYGRYGPAYPASKETQVNIIPAPFPIYRGKFLRVGDDTNKPITTRIFRRDRIKLDFDFGLNFPVDSEEIDARTGMPDLDLLAEIGPELELEFVRGPKVGNAFLALQMRGAFSMDGLRPEWRGLIFSSEVRYNRQLFSEANELSVRVTPEWAGNQYMDFFYGVAPEFATADRDAFEAKGGYLGTKTVFTLRHDFSEEFSIRTGVRFGFYQGARNRDSALFTANTTSEIYLAFLWKFWESKELIADDP